MRVRFGVAAIFAGLVGLLGSGVAVAQAAGAVHWVGSWASSQQVPETRNLLDVELLRDATLRQVIHLTVGGSQLRVRVSNVFGTAPLHLTAVHVARPVSIAGAPIDISTDKAVTFNGAPDVTIPAGAEYISDALSFPVAPQADLTISMHFAEPPVGETSHPGSRATTYVAHGDLVSAADMPGATTVEHWYQLSGVDVAGAPKGRALVTLGDSITDGHAATTNGNDRWPDVLARRMLADKSTRDIGVLNVGTGGNRLLLDGLGPNALARFDRDVIVQSAVHAVIVLEGINDLGTLSHDGDATPAQHQALVAHMEGAYAQMITRAHAHGIRIIGATILPFGGAGYFRPASEADRQAVNAWIRDPQHFDGVVDFDQVMRDPAQPDHLRSAFDSGDHLHPSPAGYKAMGEAVPLGMLSK